MNHDITLAVPCFGTSPRWVAMLEVWLSHRLKSGCRLPVAVLSDPDTALPAFSDDVTVLRFDPHALPGIIRPGQPFDNQGSLIVQAIRFLGPVVVMDSDALMLRDPTAEFARFPRHALIGMAPDAGGRVLTLPEGVLPERNGGVLYFGDAQPEEREVLARAYRDTFAELVRDHPTNPLLTQFVWSVVWHRVGRYMQGGAFDIPRRLNSSHIWGESPDVVVRHEHGKVKWHRVPGELARA